MEEDAEYQRQLDIFARCCTEKRIELLHVGEVIATLAHRQRFLDIGAGGGDLTIPVSQSFRETHIVEPNARQAAMFRRRYPKFIVHEGTWEQTVLTGERFDLVLCSHVLYYIPAGAWMPTIQKMYGHLEDGGAIAIVLQSPLGEVADFFNHFASYDVEVLGLWRDLVRLYGDDTVNVRYFFNEIFTRTLDEMTTIGLFLLLDLRYKEREREIRRYFRQRHKVPGGYRLIQDEILLTVRKTAGVLPAD
jgi:SAM-dependent methyltransferase